MKRKIKQGMTRYMLNIYPPKYVEGNVFLFCVNRCFVNKNEVVFSKKQGAPFNCISYYLEGVGHYFLGENKFLKRTYPNRNKAIKDAKRLCDLANWLLDQGYDEDQVIAELTVRERG